MHGSKKKLTIVFGGSLLSPIKVVADIIAGSGQRIAQQVIGLGDGTQIEVPAADCFVRGHLPSGEFALGYAPGDVDQIVCLEPEQDSPRESLGWAYYLENPGRGKPKAPLHEPEVGLWIRRSGEWSTSALSFKVGRQQRDFLTIDVSELHPSGEEGFIAALDLSAGFPGERDLGAQLWLRVRDRFFAVPISAGAVVSVLLTFDAEGPVVSVGNSSTEAQALLGYIDQGDYSSARTMESDMLKVANDLLYDKISNPTGATIAGYYLVRFASTETFSSNAKWVQWMENLGACRALRATICYN